MTENELYDEVQKRIVQYTDGAITLTELINTLAALEAANLVIARGDE